MQVVHVLDVRLDGRGIQIRNVGQHVVIKEAAVQHIVALQDIVAERDLKIVLQLWPMPLIVDSIPVSYAKQLQVNLFLVYV